MNENILHALAIMGKGMAGIFVAILIIMAFVLLLSKIGAGKTGEKKED